MTAPTHLVCQPLRTDSDEKRWLMSLMLAATEVLFHNSQRAQKPADLTPCSVQSSVVL